MIDNQRAALRYQNKVNNAQGHFFESAIKAACALYSDRERADVDKTPEPFRVLEKSRDGKFKGRFTARAQPDFQGTLDGGRSIVFEAKYTTTDRLKWDVLTQEQRDTLERHARRGALGRSLRRDWKRILLCSVDGVAGHERAFRQKVRYRGGPRTMAGPLQWGGAIPRLRPPRKERDTMKKQHTQKMTVRVTAQTAYNLERLMLMSGQKTPGRVVDKLVREKMLALRGRNIETEETK